MMSTRLTIIEEESRKTKQQLLQRDLQIRELEEQNSKLRAENLVQRKEIQR